MIFCMTKWVEIVELAQIPFNLNETSVTMSQYYILIMRLKILSILSCVKMYCMKPKYFTWLPTQNDELIRKMFIRDAHRKWRSIETFKSLNSFIFTAKMYLTWSHILDEHWALTHACNENLKIITRITISRYASMKLHNLLFVLCVKSIWNKINA